MACLWFLVERRWVLAGVMAALGTATRPNGWRWCWRARSPRCSPSATSATGNRGGTLLSPLGFIAFQLWLGRHADEAGVWFRVQSEAWGEGASYGLTAVRKTVEAFASPFTSRRTSSPRLGRGHVGDGLLRVGQAPASADGRVQRRNHRAHAVAEHGDRPTAFLVHGLPLFISAAAYLHSDRRDWWPYVIGACSAGLVILTALYGVFGAIP
jgi:hypothetical protein